MRKPNNNASLLVVDEDQDWLDTIASLSEPFFANIIKARGAKQALQILNDQKVDLVITDTYMPQMNGVDLLKTVMAKFPSTKVLVLFPGLNGSIIQRDDILRLGAEDVMKKNELVHLLISDRFPKFLEISLGLTKF